MPPKKDDKKGPAAEDPEPDEEEKELLERELVIGFLKNKLSKYQDRGDSLLRDNLRLNDELETQQENLKDINTFLTTELTQREAQLLQLEQDHAALQKKYEDTVEKYEADIVQLKGDWAKQEEELRETIKEMDFKLKELYEFQQQKMELEQKLKDLTELLENERIQNEERVSELERKHVQEKDRLTKEMAQKIRETKANMMKLTDNQLETTTKRTILENEQMASELAYQSRQTEKLMKQNQHMLAEHAAMRRSAELSKQTETELAKRNHVYQKTIRNLLEKLKHQEESKRMDEAGLQQADDEMDELEMRCADLEKQLSQTTADHEALRMEHVKKNEQLDSFMSSQDEAVRFLVACLQDVKRQIVTVVDGASGGAAGGSSSAGASELVMLPGRLEELSLEQRERALGYLLERMHSFTSTKQKSLLGIGRPQADSGFVLPPIAAAGAVDSAAARAALQASVPAHATTYRTTGSQTSEAAPGRGSLALLLDDGSKPWGRAASSLKRTVRNADTFLRSKGPDLPTGMVRATMR